MIINNPHEFVKRLVRQGWKQENPTKSFWTFMKGNWRCNVGYRTNRVNFTRL